MDLNILAIEAAAKNALGNLSRTSLSSEGFSNGEKEAIASAIAAAIQAYDEQKQQ